MQNDENRMTDEQGNAFEPNTEEAALQLRLAERREARRLRQARRKRAVRRKRILLVLCGVLAILGGAGLWSRRHFPENTAVETTVESTEAAETETAVDEKQELLSEAALKAQQYDYDGAVALLTDSSYAEDAEVQAAVTAYTETQASCTAANNQEITHIFFHSLIVDKNRALTDDKLGHNFNSTMTTIPEFKAILEQLYARGYVLVGLHDIAETETDADGTEHMVQKQILLPEGKKPIVISQDDVCYYEYMTGRGFADKMVLDDAGTPKLQYTDAEGNVSVGDYDLVPILDAFVEEHPDFSYHGHKAILAFTGYNGILGYRTDETYDPNSENYDSGNTANENIEADRETVKSLTKALKEDGYEFASHSWGHINFTERSVEDLTRDTEKWKRNVESLLPDSCDILLYPFGADIQDWHAYDETSDAKYQMLHNYGFRYFCNVDSTQYWVQFGSDYMRQGRRNLDGYRLYESYSGAADRVSDIMDVQQVFDTDRPTPIEWN